jgi:hypothetical protein
LFHQTLPKPRTGAITPDGVGFAPPTGSPSWYVSAKACHIQLMPADVSVKIKGALFFGPTHSIQPCSYCCSAAGTYSRMLAFGQPFARKERLTTVTGAVSCSGGHGSLRTMLRASRMVFGDANSGWYSRHRRSKYCREALPDVGHFP